MAPDQPAVGEIRSGLLLRFNKGGYVIAVGETICFCPASEMYPKVLSPQLMGKMQHEPGVGYKVLYLRGDSLVVSRKEAVQAEQMAVIRKALAEGKRIEGVVHKVVQMGAFVELGGGINGFLKLADYALGSGMKDKLRRGLRVTVKVAAIDGNGKILLSLIKNREGERP